jgi:DNA polymerase delta subunit 1
MFPIDWYVNDEWNRTTVTAYGKRGAGGACASIAMSHRPVLRIPQKHEWALEKAMRRSNVSPVHMTRGDVRTLVTHVPPIPTVAATFASQAQANEVVKCMSMCFKIPRCDMFDAHVHPIPATIHRAGTTTAAWLDDAGREVACEAFPPFVLASWDIEAFSSTGKFPQPHNLGDCIICIGVQFRRFTESASYAKVVFTWKPCEPVQGVEIACFRTEAAMLRGFCERIATENVDIMIAYNSFGFDDAYLHGRCVVLGVEDALTRLARTQVTPGVDVIKMSSAAMGSNDWTLLRTPGILQLDLLVHIRREYKLERYSLDAVSEHFLGERKIDLTPSEMFCLWAQGTPSSIARIAGYCIQDCALPLALCERLQVIPALLEMARATFVPPQWLLTRGQTIKVFSQICRKAWAEGYMVPMEVPEGFKNESTYEGARVLDAVAGLHTDAKVLVLDFASLYPSIMRAFNICPSTLTATRPASPDNFTEIALGDDSAATVWFAKRPVGVIPALLTELAEFRKKAKRQMAEAKARGDSMAAALYDGRQLAYKVSMNSCYGFFGVQRGFLPVVDVARAVTAKGRDMIAIAKAIAETSEGAQVIYGDTDSIFCKLAGIDMARAFDIGTRLADSITAALPEPLTMEFEKCYDNMLLVSKKRYAALKYTTADKCDGIDTKGIQVVRRDSCPLVRSLAMDVLRDVIELGDVDAATHRVKRAIADLLEDRVPIRHLTITKTLAASYKMDKQPQVTVARLIAQRTSGGGPQSGDRVAYVHVLKRGIREISQAVDDPAFVEANGVVPDGMYYVTNQLRTPIETLLDVATGGKCWDSIFAPFVASQSSGYRAKRARIVDAQRPIRDFFGKAAAK